VNKEQVQDIIGYGVVRDHDDSTGKKEENILQRYDESTDEEEYYSTLGRIPPLL
jgi:hypothetical protein